MRHRHATKTLDRKVGPRLALVKNLAGSLILYEKIKTTDARARVVRTYVEKLVTLGKVPSLANRRLLLKRLPTENAVKKVLEVLGPRYVERKGGYTRLTKLGSRLGDRAKVVLVEFV